MSELGCVFNIGNGVASGRCQDRHFGRNFESKVEAELAHRLFGAVCCSGTVSNVTIDLYRDQTGTRAFLQKL